MQLGGVPWWGGGGGGWGGGGSLKYTHIFFMMGGVGGVGTDSLKTDSRFDFLSFFNEKDEEDAVPDSFFINNQCSPYANTTINCNYIDTDKICKLQTDKILVLSLNIQSLPSKFLELSELVNEFTSCPDVICLQETWKVINNAMFPLVNYHNLETNTRSVARGGGVGIYVKQNLSYKILKQYSVFSE